MKRWPMALVACLVPLCLATLPVGAAPGDPGEPVQLNVEGTQVVNGRDYTLTGDGTTVVYSADDGTIDVLYAVPAGGGASVRLSAPEDGVLSYFRVSPDSSTVVFTVTDASENDQVYAVPITGGSATLLTSGIGVDSLERLRQVIITPDSATVLFVAEAGPDSPDQLFAVPIGGGTAIQLSDPDVDVQASSWRGPDSTSDILLTPEGDTVVYEAGMDGPWDITAVDIDGSNRRKLAVGQGPVLSNDGSRVVYQRFPHLYSVPVTGGAEARLSGDMVRGGNAQKWAVSEDSTHVVYVADQDVNNQRELYSVAIAGGVPTRLNGPLPPGGDVGGNTARPVGVAVTPDSRSVVYLADEDRNNRRELYVVPINGGAPVKLNGRLVAGGDVKQDFIVTPDSSTVLYKADQRINNKRELFVVALDGTDRRRLSGRITDGGDVGRFAATPDSRRAVYRADKVTNKVWELFTVTLEGDGRAKLNGELPDRGDVHKDFAIGPDSDLVVFLADQDVNNTRELWSVRLPG